MTYLLHKIYDNIADFSSSIIQSSDHNIMQFCTANIYNIMSA